MGVAGVGLCKLLHTDLQEVADHDEDDGTPEGGIPQNGNVAPGPLLQRLSAA